MDRLKEIFEEEWCDEDGAMRLAMSMGLSEEEAIAALREFREAHPDLVFRQQ